MARHRFAVLFLAAISLVSSFWFLLDVLGAATHSKGTFGVEAFESRFNQIRPTMQPHAEYGYLSDTPASDPSGPAEFHLTQYTLAPAIIKPSVNEPLVILNEHAKQLDAKLLQANHLAPVQDFTNGVVLCRRVLR